MLLKDAGEGLQPAADKLLSTTAFLWECSSARSSGEVIEGCSDVMRDPTRNFNPAFARVKIPASFNAARAELAVGAETENRSMRSVP